MKHSSKIKLFMTWTPTVWLKKGIVVLLILYFLLKQSIHLKFMVKFPLASLEDSFFAVYSVFQFRIYKQVNLPLAYVLMSLQQFSPLAKLASL